jgi:hypothetical protein
VAAKSFENLSIKGYVLVVPNEVPRQVSGSERWAKRVGVAAFLFFLIKGILWLIVPAIVAYLSLK